MLTFCKKMPFRFRESSCLIQIGWFEVPCMSGCVSYTLLWNCWILICFFHNCRVFGGLEWFKYVEDSGEYGNLKTDFCLCPLGRHIVWYRLHCSSIINHISLGSSVLSDVTQSSSTVLESLGSLFSCHFISSNCFGLCWHHFLLWKGLIELN